MRTKEQNKERIRRMESLFEEYDHILEVNAPADSAAVLLLIARYRKMHKQTDVFIVNQTKTIIFYRP